MQVHEHPWKWDAATEHGVSPLHVAAVLQDEGAVALAIIRAYPLAARLWQTAAAFDGLTPAHCAARMGRDALNAAVQRRLKELATPFQTREEEVGGQKLVQGLLPEELLQLLAETALHKRRARAGKGEVDGEGEGEGDSDDAAAAAEAATVPQAPREVLDRCLAGCFVQPSLEARFRGFRAMQTLQSDQLQLVLVLLLTFSAISNHLTQVCGVACVVMTGRMGHHRRPEGLECMCLSHPTAVCWAALLYPMRPILHTLEALHSAEGNEGI